MSRPYGLAPPGFRLPDDTHIGAVCLQVDSLLRSIEYYEQVLGLRVRDRTAGEATLSVDGDDRPLVRLRARSGVSPAPRRGAFGLYHFAIRLPDRAALGRFAAHLSTIEIRVGMADHSVSEAFYLTDPDGLGIEVYADRPRSVWRHHDGELAMTTDPLDVPSLIAAGAGEPWSEAPAGTTMGHVHLHVGDLRVAEAFYHAALGFDKTVWSRRGALFLSAGGYHHHLGVNTWSPGPSATPRQARLLEWELVVPDEAAVSQAAQSLRSAGRVVEDLGHGSSATDPWGTRLRVSPA